MQAPTCAAQQEGSTIVMLITYTAAHAVICTTHTTKRCAAGSTVDMTITYVIAASCGFWRAKILDYSIEILHRPSVWDAASYASQHKHTKSPQIPALWSSSAGTEVSGVCALSRTCLLALLQCRDASSVYTYTCERLAFFTRRSLTARGSATAARSTVRPEEAEEEAEGGALLGATADIIS